MEHCTGRLGAVRHWRRYGPSEERGRRRPRRGAPPAQVHVPTPTPPRRPTRPYSPEGQLRHDPPVIVIFFLARRTFVEGITASGVKGQPALLCSRLGQDATSEHRRTLHAPRPRAP